MTLTRDSLISKLKPILPKGFTLHPSRFAPDAVEKPTVIIGGEDELKNSSAEKGARESKFLVTLVEPDTDQNRGADRLEAEVLDLIKSIDRLPNQITYDQAKRVKFGNTPNAYDINLTVITQKEK